MRLGVRALGVLIELVSFEKNFHAAIAEKAVARAFHFSHRLDGRHIAVEQRGRFLKIIVVEFVWHRISPSTKINRSIWLTNFGQTLMFRNRLTPFASRSR